MRKIRWLVLAVLLMGMGCEGACYYTDVYPDGSVRYFCYFGHNESECENSDGDVGFLGETTSVDDFVKGECCKEEHDGKTYTILNGEDCS